MDSQTIPEWRRHLREWVDRKHNGKKLPAARELGITVVTLRKLLGADPPPVPHMGTIRRISRATEVSVETLLRPFDSVHEQIGSALETDFFAERTLADGRSWDEVTHEVLNGLPQEARARLEEFDAWAGRR